MLQNSVVLIDHKTFPESDYVLIDSEHSSKSSFSKLSDELLKGNQPPEENPSINYTINSPTSPKSLHKHSHKKAKILQNPIKNFFLKNSLSINESFQEPIIDSRFFNIGDLSAIEYKSNLQTNSPENTNLNNSFVTEHDMGLFMVEEKEVGVMALKEAFVRFLNKNLVMIKDNINQINNVLVDNLTIMWNVLRICNEKSEAQKCLVRYVIYVFKENLIRNEGFVPNFNGVMGLKEKCEGFKGSEIAGLGLGTYGIRMDLDLVKSSLREEAICFLFKVKNFEEKQKLMNILMSTQ